MRQGWWSQINHGEVQTLTCSWRWFVHLKCNYLTFIVTSLGNSCPWPTSRLWKQSRHHPWRFRKTFNANSNQILWFSCRHWKFLLLPEQTSLPEGSLLRDEGWRVVYLWFLRTWHKPSSDLRLCEPIFLSGQVGRRHWERDQKFKTRSGVRRHILWRSLPLV